MKPKKSHSFVIFASIASLIAASSASAATLFWSGNGTSQGGGGTWDTSTARWGTVAGGPYTSAWNNANNDTAEFNSTTGTITLGTGVTVGRINAKTGAGGNIIAEGAGLNTITFGVTGGIINNSANTTTGRIFTANAKVTGTNLTIQGPTTTAGGVVNLNRNNTLSGTLAITNTTLQIGNGGTAGQLNSGNYANTISVGNNARFFYGSSLDQTLGGIISGAGTITKNSSGSVLTFTANNTYTGTTTISQGILQIGNGGTTGTLGNNSNTSIAAGAELRIDRSTDNTGYTYSGALSGGGAVNVLASRRFNFSSSQTSSGNLSFLVDGVLGINTTAGTTSVQLGELTGSGQIQRAGNPGGAATLVIGGNGTSSSYSGTIVSAELGLEKVGAGSLTLTNALSYGGTTTVTEGTLRVNTNHTGGGVYTVGVNGTLQGNGSTASAINVSGVLAPGASVESFASGELSMLTGSTFEYELDSSVALATGADLQIVSGSLNLTGLVTLTLADIATSPTAFGVGTVFSLINYDGAWNNGLFTYGGDTIANGDEFAAGLNTWRLDYNAATGGSNFTGDQITGSFVNITAIPEPSGALLGGLGALLLLRRRRD